MRNDRALDGSLGNGFRKARENANTLAALRTRGYGAREPGIRKPVDLCASDGLTNAHALGPRPGSRFGAPLVWRPTGREVWATAPRPKAEAHRCSGTPR